MVDLVICSSYEDFIAVHWRSIGPLVDIFHEFLVICLTISRH